MTKAILLSFCLSLFINYGLTQCPQPVWSDEFDGETLDLSKWAFQIGDGCPDLCGWGNNELQHYQENNLTVSDGTLKIEARRETVAGRQYTSSRIRSIDLADFTYGRMEARIKLPTGQGLWPAFWMLSSNEPYGTWAASGEIDIMELIGSEPNTVHGTIHYGGEFPNNRSSGTEYNMFSADFSEDFHDFAVEWSENEIRWFVDGYQYARETNVSVLPSRWPFDHDFHFLLNVAVGGNWPGSPNSSTSFPQIMEVDYVRVYDTGVMPYTTGPREVNAEDESKYTVENLPSDAMVTWSVPDDAGIQLGIGNEPTNEVIVKWGESSGSVVADIVSSCFTGQLTIDVAVEPPPPPLAVESVLENFDDPGLIEFVFSTGNLSEVDNPSPSELNNSTLTGQYARNGSELFDVLVYSTDAVDNAGDFIQGEKRFYMDVLTDAPIGTEILFQLENQTRSLQNFPTGRNSRFTATTTTSNEWERLEFSFVDQPDPATANSIINQLVFLFATNTTTSNTFYFDNFSIYAPDFSSSTESIPGADLIEIYPNPADTKINVDMSQVSGIVKISCFNLAGLEIMSTEVNNDQILQINTINWPAGTYVIQFTNLDKATYARRVVIER